MPSTYFDNISTRTRDVVFAASPPDSRVSERTGLTPATLRAWERRYAAVAPDRTPGSPRLYSDADIQRLRLIGRLSAIGFSLAELAQASTTSLAVVSPLLEHVG